MHDTSAVTVEVRRQDGSRVLTLTPAAADTGSRGRLPKPARTRWRRHARTVASPAACSPAMGTCSAPAATIRRRQQQRKPTRVRPAHNIWPRQHPGSASRSSRAINGNAHAGGFSLIALCDLACSPKMRRWFCPRRRTVCFPLLALAIVRTVCRKGILRPVYRARLLNASEAQSPALGQRVVPRLGCWRVRSSWRPHAPCQPGHHQYRPDLYYDTRCATPQMPRASALCAGGCTQALEESPAQ